MTILNGKALVAYEESGPFKLVDTFVDTSKVQPHQVLIRFKKSGICHTDLGSWSGAIPARFPCILGHEGAGVVEFVPENSKSDLKVGDEVVATFCHCKQCSHCGDSRPSSCFNFVPLNMGFLNVDFTPADVEIESQGSGKTAATSYFGQSSFQSLSIADTASLVKVDKGLPMELICAFACGFQTGFSTVIECVQRDKTRTFDHLPGNQRQASLEVSSAQTLAVFGIGAVGLASIAAGKLVGLQKVIALDVNDSRLELAKKAGATDVINVRGLDNEKVVEAIQKASATGKGATVTIEASGNSSALKNAVTCLATRGKCIVLGVQPAEYVLDVPAMAIL
ncbi:GroES-like protein, partial [Violaceomyces palustris]